ncbi:MAG: hypothetical protein ABW318_20365 [Vicinamibacterales bacterium]
MDEREELFNGAASEGGTILLFLAASVALLSGCASNGQPSIDALTKCTGSKLNPKQQQQQRQKEVVLRDSTLAELYRNKPQAKEDREIRRLRGLRHLGSLSPAGR